MGGLPGAGDANAWATHREQMVKRHEKRLAALKTQLQLTPAQEGAWQAFEQAHRPPSKPLTTAPDREALGQLKTPERIEAMQQHAEAHHNAMQAQMKQVGDATRAFYAQLTPEQQKIFDAETLPRNGKRGAEAR
jgi:protein CpxP